MWAENFGLCFPRNRVATSEARRPKGISVASQAVKTGGAVVVAAECADGLGHSDFEEVLAAA